MGLGGGGGRIHFLHAALHSGPSEEKVMNAGVNGEGELEGVSVLVS